MTLVVSRAATTCSCVIGHPLASAAADTPTARRAIHQVAVDRLTHIAFDEAEVDRIARDLTVIVRCWRVDPAFPENSSVNYAECRSRCLSIRLWVCCG